MLSCLSSICVEGCSSRRWDLRACRWELKELFGYDRLDMDWEIVRFRAFEGCGLSFRISVVIHYVARPRGH